MGTEAGEGAQNLLPDRMVVGAPTSEHCLAVIETRELIADRTVPVNFAAAFELEGVRVGADILERLGGDSLVFRIRDANSSTCINAAQHNTLVIATVSLLGPDQIVHLRLRRPD